MGATLLVIMNCKGSYFERHIVSNGYIKNHIRLSHWLSMMFSLLIVTAIHFVLLKWQHFRINYAGLVRIR